MPEHLKACVASWRRVNPGWDHIVWTDIDFGGWFDNQDVYDRAEDHTTHVGQFRSDIARYEILRDVGGVYVDCDFEALRPIDALLDGVECFAAWETNGVWVNNALIGAGPGHPLLFDAVAGLTANVEAHRGERPNVMTGPQYFTPLAVKRAITVFPSEAFYPYRWDQLDRAGHSFPDAYAVHHWANRRKQRRAAFPEVRHG
ncbi:MAG: glycosyltransferase [Acidimicrobiales bacterium]|nr:glycosyltransferase [Acidimicrobiales bacterium]